MLEPVGLAYLAAAPGKLVLESSNLSVELGDLLAKLGSLCVKSVGLELFELFMSKAHVWHYFKQEGVVGGFFQLFLKICYFLLLAFYFAFKFSYLLILSKTERLLLKCLGLEVVYLPLLVLYNLHLSKIWLEYRVGQKGHFLLRNLRLDHHCALLLSLLLSSFFRTFPAIVACFICL